MRNTVFCYTIVPTKYFRVPANCAHTPMVHPTALTSPPKITATSPRPYFLLNSGTVVLNPSKQLFDSIGNFLFLSLIHI